ncbi:DUF397 domain-containing protein [Amycolatopsis nigrescens]|uniref:DUF397 domain-containing protein n=1 Tax=Amycolatopsis nigrescens TaxID=381445 RepID=UPI000A033079|nr:DUF397 domain-containing protein [Amycolatopsis nigrescens]
MRHETAGWRKSSYSGASSGSTNDCVEVRIDTRGAAVRDTKDRPAGHIEVGPAAWRAFLERAAR